MSIKIQIASDLCLPDGNSDWQKYIKKTGEILVIAGNIAKLESNQNTYEKILGEICVMFDYVYLVPGLLELSGENCPIEYLYTQLTHMAKDIVNLSVLYNDYVDIGESLRIFGTPLWYFCNTKYSELKIKSVYGRAGTITWLRKKYYDCLYELEEAVHTGVNKEHRKVIAVSSFPPQQILCKDINTYIYGGTIPGIDVPVFARINLRCISNSGDSKNDHCIEVEI